MFIWPDGTVTGSVRWAELEDFVDRKDDKSVTKAGWESLAALLAERRPGTPEGSGAGDQPESEASEPEPNPQQDDDAPAEPEAPESEAPEPKPRRTRKAATKEG